MEYAIETSALRKRLGKQEVIRGCDLQVPAGRVYGFIGPNGAGKTTVMRLLLGILRPDAGEIRMLGRSMPRDRQAVLSRTGAFIESPALYDHLSAEANLDITRRLLGLPPGEIGRVLDIVGMAGHARRKIAEYSLGMRQRTALARTLLGKPELLLLDEPTNGLDPEGIAGMRGLIRELPERIGATVFVSSHLLGEIEQVADHAGLLREGRLVMQGPLRTLLVSQRVLQIRVSMYDHAVNLLKSWGHVPRAEGGDSIFLRCPRDTDFEGFAAGINRRLNAAGVQVFAVGERKRSLEDLYRASAGAGLKGVAA